MRKSQFFKIHWVAWYAAFLFCAPAYSTTITGDDETVESTPTPAPKILGPTPKPNKDDTETAGPSPTPSPISPDTESPSQSQTPGKLDEFPALMRGALEDFRNKNYPEALIKVLKAEVLRPDSAEAINFHGAICAETGDYTQARLFYQKARALQPNSFWPSYNLAEVDFMQRKFTEARNAFRQVIKHYPENELLRFKIVLTYLEQKDESNAKAELEKIPFPSKTAAYYFAWAAWEFHHDHPKAATDWIDSGVRVFGRSRTQFLYESLADLELVPLPRP